MSPIRSLILLGLAACFNPSAHAFHEAALGFQASVFANSSIMASPPLPMLIMKRGQKQFTIQPAYFEGGVDSMDSVNDSSHRTEGDFSGAGGAVSFNHAFSDSWGYFILLGGNQLKGDFSYTTLSGCGTPPCGRVDARDIQSGFYEVGAGLNWTMIGGDPKDFFSAGILFGPAVTAGRLKQRVMNTDASGVVTDDSQMTSEPTVMTAMLGLQLGFRFGWLLVNPYFMGVTAFGGKCFDYKVTEHSVDGSLDGQSTSSCGGNSDPAQARTTNQVDFQAGSSAIGVNLNIVPWGLGVTAFAIPDKPNDVTLKELDIQTYMISFSISN